MTKVEEVARAIYAAWEANPPKYRDMNVFTADEMARAAIAAMRGATSEMMEAGGIGHVDHLNAEGNAGLFCSRHCDLTHGEKCQRPDDCGKTVHDDCYDRIFNRMIDAALAEDGNAA